MGRVRSPNRDKAKQMYLESKGKMKLKDIAEKLGVLDTQIRKWKSTDKWDKELKGTLPIKKRNVTNKKETKKTEHLRKTKVENGTALDIPELTERQRLFAEEFVRVPIAYKAAIKAGYSKNCAFIEGSRLIRNVKVKAYIDYLKQLKRESLLIGEEDLVDMHMRIAFSDITDFVELGRERVPLMYKGLPLIRENPLTGEKEPVTKLVNSVRLKEDFEIDGSLISEVSTGKDGVKLKLYDKQKSLDWLSSYFAMNPMDKHKLDYDNAKLQIERERLEADKQKDNQNDKDITIKVTLEDDDS